jgi:uncharacterized repeat protein (TIGR01451 family)
LFQLHLQLIRRLLALLALACMLVPAAVNAQVAGAPFTCDVVFYQMRNVGNNSLPVKFAAVNATVTPTAVYTTVQGTPINSLGYNPVDNYMYGIRATAVAGQGPQLYRIGQLGYELVGIIQPSALMSATILNNFTPTAGVFDAGGRYYFAGQGGGNISPSAIFRVDYIPLSGNPTVANQYTITAAVTNFGDFDFNGAGSPNGLLMGSTGTNHYRINLATGATSIDGTATVSTVALATANVGGVGSAFYDAFTSRFYVFDNTNSKFWQITNPQVGTPDGVATAAVTYVGPPAFAGPYTPTDGTSCPISGTRVADLAITKTDGVASVPNGAVVSYTITVTNAGPYPANYAVVRDPANTPALTKTSVTCTAPGGPPTAVCPPTLSIASLEAGVPVLTFPPGTTLVFTVNAKVSATVSVANTATVTPAADTTDPNPSNNTATDTDVITATNTVVVTAASICKAGTVESYTNLVVNGDFALASPLTTAATVGLPNTYNVANSVSLQTGSRSYVVGSANVQQNPFPGDGARSIPGSNSWLLSNGKTPVANYSVWSQVVSGLTPGKVYEFMTYMSNASNPGSASAPLPSMQLQANGTNLGGATFAPVAIEAVGADTWTLVQGTFTAVVSTATVSIIDTVAANSPDPSSGDIVGIAQATVRQCSDSADVAVTKTNGTNTVVSTGTTAYTVTLVNLSATVNATNTQVIDPAASGIIKTTVTCTASGASTCPGGGSTSTPTVGAFEAGVTVPLIVANGTVTFRVFASITAAPGATVSNIVTVAGIGYTDSNPANNQATDTDNVIGQANLTVTKTNSPTGTVTAGGTTSYIVTVSNTGPATAQNISLTDPAVAGLRCTAITCTGTVGAASCPAPASVTIGALQGAGIQLPLMTPPSSVSFQIDCGVTATGQ